jgi:hypothetical protein
MASKRQTAANRLNAKRSTGPQSPEGKDRSSQNAITHGLSAKASLLPNESPEEFYSLRGSVIDALKPEGVFELEFVERITNLLWRLRRIPDFEVALLSSIEADERSYRTYHLDESVHLISGKAVETFLRKDLSGKLSRYETTMQRQLTSLLKELRDMQKRRKDGEKSQEALPAPE